MVTYLLYICIMRVDVISQRLLCGLLTMGHKAMLIIHTTLEINIKIQLADTKFVTHLQFWQYNLMQKSFTLWEKTITKRSFSAVMEAPQKYTETKLKL